MCVCVKTRLGREGEGTKSKALKEEKSKGMQPVYPQMAYAQPPPYYVAPPRALQPPPMQYMGPPQVARRAPQPHQPRMPVYAAPPVAYLPYIPLPIPPSLLEIEYLPGVKRTRCCMRGQPANAADFVILCDNFVLGVLHQGDSAVYSIPPGNHRIVAKKVRPHSLLVGVQDSQSSGYISANFFPGNVISLEVGWTAVDCCGTRHLPHIEIVSAATIAQKAAAKPTEQPPAEEAPPTPPSPGTAAEAEPEDAVEADDTVSHNPAGPVLSVSNSVVS